MSLFEKIKWVLGILLIFVVVLTTNLVDRGNFNRIRNSVATIYEDRIVANDLIYEINSYIHEKEIAVRTADAGFFTQRNPGINETLAGLIDRYEQTKITSVEQRVFDNLKKNLKELENFENESYGTAGNERLLQSLETIKANLSELAKIQLSEAKREVSSSERTFETIDLFTKIEIIFLVMLAIIVQVIILYKPKN